MRDKQEVRKKFLKIRKDISVTQQKIYSQSILEKFCLLQKWHSSDIVLSYVKVGSEISPDPIHQFLSKINCVSFFLPHFLPKDRHADHFYPTKMGIQNDGAIIYEKDPLLPIFDMSALKKQSQILCLVPLVAFDEEGMRLGRGAGFYDKFIKKTRDFIAAVKLNYPEKPQLNFTTIGLAYAQQQHPKILPSNFQDERLDFVVTPEKIWSFNQKF